MGSSHSKKNDENKYLVQIEEVIIDDLDFNKIGTLQMKAIQQLKEKVQKLELKRLIKLCIDYLLYIYALTV